MKLTVDFSNLKHAVDKMGAELVSFDVGGTEFDGINIDDILGTTGSTIDPEFLEEKGGLLSYHGRQVLLYIPDHQYHGVEAVLNGRAKGNRYHVSDCATIKQMKGQNKYERYIATNRVDGQFEITDKVTINNPVLAELDICQNCLSKLNYQNFSKNKKNVLSTFTISSFFETYSTLFEHMPKLVNKLYGIDYTNDWKEVSSTYRKQKSYTCEECETNFTSKKNLLHTHHINGVKSDNKISNLKAVCIDCHRKEPNHDHIMMSKNELSSIYKLRCEQGIDTNNDWTNVYKLSDLSIHGYLNLLQVEKPNSVPTPGYFHIDSKGKEVLFDLAWPKSKRAIITNSEIEEQTIDGWKVYNLGGILNKINA